MQTSQEKGLMALLGKHQHHWQTIGEAFGLCMGGGVECLPEDEHSNAFLIIKHCLDKYNEGYAKGRAEALRDAECMCRANLCAICANTISVARGDAK